MSLFTYEGFDKFFRAVAQKCQIIRLCDWSGGPGLILRHDVDLDVGAAFRLSRVELNCGILSSFYFLTTCSTYNVRSKIPRRMIREMAENGFEIGLHFDPEVYGEQDLDSLQIEVQREAEILEQITGQKVRSVSLHNPSVSNIYPIFKGYLNAYDERIFSSEKYLSDSRMIYRRDPWKFCLEATNDTRQILIHPMHVSEAGAAYPAPMLKYVDHMIEEIDKSFRLNSEYSRLTTLKLSDYYQNSDVRD